MDFFSFFFGDNYMELVWKSSSIIPVLCNELPQICVFSVVPVRHKSEHNSDRERNNWKFSTTEHKSNCYFDCSNITWEWVNWHKDIKAWTNTQLKWAFDSKDQKSWKQIKHTNKKSVETDRVLFFWPITWKTCWGQRPLLTSCYSCSINYA